MTTVSKTIQMPSGVWVSTQGDLFITAESAQAVMRLSSRGILSTVASFNTGSFDSGFTGAGAPVFFNQPHGPASDAAGNLYVADMANYAFRRVSPDGKVTTLAGTCLSPGSVDGAGGVARFSAVRGIAVTSSGTVYVADYDNQTVRKGVPFAVNAFAQDDPVVVGSSPSLAVAVSGSGQVSFQWFFNGAPLPNQTNSSLTLGQVSRSSSGLYSVVVSNSLGNWTEFSGTLRVLVPPVLQPPQVEPNGAVRLLFQDEDGGVPFDLSKCAVQWRPNLPEGADTNWQSLASSLFLTNGFVSIEDTNALAQPARFYRALEQ